MSVPVVTSSSSITTALTYDSVNGFEYTGSYSSAYFSKDSVAGNVKHSYTYHRDTKNTTPMFSITGDKNSLASAFDNAGMSSGALANIDNYVTLSTIDSAGKFGISLGQSITDSVKLDGFALTLTNSGTTNGNSLKPYFIDPDGDVEHSLSGYASFDSGKFSFMIPGSDSGWIVSGNDSVVTYQQSKGYLFTIDGLQSVLSNYSFSLVGGNIIGSSSTASSTPITLATYAADGENYTVKLYENYVDTNVGKIMLTRGDKYTNASIGFSIINSVGNVVADIDSQSKVNITFGQIREDLVLNASIGVDKGTYAMTKNTGAVTEYTYGGSQSAIFSLSGLDNNYVLYSASLDASDQIIGYREGNTTVTLGSINRGNGIITLTEDAFKKTNGEFITNPLTLTDNIAGDLTYQLSIASADNYYDPGRAPAQSSLTAIDGGYTFVNGGLSAGYNLNVSSHDSINNTATTELTYIPSSSGQTFSLTGGVKEGLTTDDLIGGANAFTTTLSTANKDIYITKDTEGGYELKAGTYVLTSSLSLDSILSITGDTVIDLNGQTISFTNSSIEADEGAIKVSGYDLTILDSGGGSTAGVISTASGNGIFVEEGKLIVNGGTINGKNYGINNTTGNIVINGGTIIGTCTGDNLGIYHPQNGTLTINGGTITLKPSGAMQVINNDASYSSGIKCDDFTQNDGSLGITVTGTAGRGISADNVTTNGGTLTITNSGNGQTGSNDTYTAKGIKADQSIALNDGTITISMSGTGGKGIKSAGTYSQGKSDGNGPTLKVTTTGSSLGGSSGGGGGGWPGQESSGSSAKGIKVQGTVTISGGTTEIYTSTNGAEGLESKTSVTIAGGKHYLKCYDDCINSSGNIYFNGGVTVCYGYGNDAVDSNAGRTGAITIGNGVVFAYTTKGSPEEGLDCDNNSYIQITGTGIGISAGGSQGGGGMGGGSGNTI